jgi:hypothetical protein
MLFTITRSSLTEIRAIAVAGLSVKLTAERCGLPSRLRVAYAPMLRPAARPISFESSVVGRFPAGVCGENSVGSADADLTILI